ncbi:MAG: molybdopterin molybdenumtransferase MoeA [Planctomycetes bacterium]|nr:molybdopterin molybdenumtransferase MoeA [Planctomycetota bacterium]NOG53277.1 molybdopterin molybdotransferase MoeA [Planctomycetota bacterium]
MPNSHNTFQFDAPNPALTAWLEAVHPITGSERVAWSEAHGRILAEPIRTDRPSPPCSVSAMDGYAVRLADIAPGKTLTVAGEVRIGHEPPPMPNLPGSALRIVTGAPVPDEADLVIKREDVNESDSTRIALPEDCSTFTACLHIRTKGENAPAGAEVVAAGAGITSPIVAALTGFGIAKPTVMPRLKVAILTTGDELLPVEGCPSPWQIRDSNGPSLRALVESQRWMTVQTQQHVADQQEALTQRLAEAVAECDAVLLTGGVSMGNYDFVPAAVQAVGGRIVFHKLPIRPGKPILAAVGAGGRPIIGLPGNPVSVLTTATRLALPVLAKRAGAVGIPTRNAPTLVRLADSALCDKTLGLWWYRPVRLERDADPSCPVAHLAETRGSGDFAAIATTDGFVEIPPNETGPGPRRFWPWQ